VIQAHVPQGAHTEVGAHKKKKDFFFQMKIRVQTVHILNVHEDFIKISDLQSFT
jgi:hypothetical protein